MIAINPAHLVEALAAEYRATLKPAAPKPATPTRPPSWNRQVDSPADQCRRYLSTFEEPKAGQGGGPRTFQIARVIWNDYGLDEPEGWDLLCEFNSRWAEPWNEADGPLRDSLRKKWDDAVGKGPGPEGRGYRVRKPGWRKSSPPPPWPPAGPAAPVDADPGGGEAEEVSFNPADGGEDFFDPFRLGRLLVPRVGDQPALVHWRGEWWRWEAGRYSRVSDDEFKTRAWSTIRAECERAYQQQFGEWVAGGGAGDRPMVKQVTIKAVSSAVSAAASMCLVPMEVEWPVLLQAENGDHGPGGLSLRSPDPKSRECIAVTNGRIDVKELIETGTTTLVPPSPLYFTPAALPVAFDPAADCPKFRSFMDVVTGGDVEVQAVLQEMVGYLLRFDLSHQMFFVLTGDGGNGKSTFLAAVRALLGDHNISAVKLEDFGERFQLTATLGKLVNAVAEVGDMDRVAEATLKSFTAGDLMNFDRKNKEPLNARPTAKLLLSCNLPPRFADRTDGVWRRCQIIPFKTKIAKKDKVKGMDKPEFWVRHGEVPGILNWALVGMLRLYRQDGFSSSVVCDRAVGAHRESCNPVKQFVNEYVLEAANGSIPTMELYSAYVTWCRLRNHRPLTDNTFGMQLRTEIKGLDTRRPRVTGKRVMVYSGIGWAEGRPDELLREYDSRHGYPFNPHRESDDDEGAS